MGWADFGGFAALSDLEDEHWKLVYRDLEVEQSKFLERDHQFRSLGYRWPRDALHTWSRIWEYPFALLQVEQVRQRMPHEQLQVTDFGSGVTFFPFAVARRGCNVTCVDIDP